MTAFHINNFFKTIFRNKIKIIILAFFYIPSLFLIIMSGAFFQYFTAAFNQSNCYECSMKIGYIKEFYFSSSSIFFIIPALIVFIMSLFIRKRLQSYLALLFVTWISLLLTDLVLCMINKNLSLSFMMVNFIYDLVGAMILSLLVCFSNSMVYYLHNEKKLSIFLSSVAPFVLSVLITLIMTIIVYLLYARQPLEVELEVSEGANINYYGGEDSGESFGFLNDKSTSTPTLLDVMDKGELTYEDVKGISSLNIYIVSGCYPNLAMENIPPADKNKTMMNVKSINLKNNFPITGYVQGESIKVIPQGASQLYMAKSDKEYMLASHVADSNIVFNSNNSILTAGFAFLPFKDGGFVNQFEYEITINNKAYKLSNYIEPMSRLDKNKKMKCSYQQITPNNHSYSVKGKYVTGVVMSIIPNDVMIFKDSPTLTVHSGFSFYKKVYPKIDKVYGDISNGKLTMLSGVGLSHLIINDKPYGIEPESKITIPSGNLIGLVNKNNKIKVYGTADLLFVDNKILNLRKITYIQSKLAIFGSSIIDVVKYLFGLGFGVVIIRFVYMYFKKEVDENMFI